LLSNYPNPFNSATVISYDLPKLTPVRLSIYNILGEKICSLVEAFQNPGKHSIVWNAAGVRSGVYFARLEGSSNSLTIKMILLK
jgi:hypothetical protein